MASNLSVLVTVIALLLRSSSADFRQDHTLPPSQHSNHTLRAEHTPRPKLDCQCGISHWSALQAAIASWDLLKTHLSDRVELLAFDGTLLHQVNHSSLRRTLRSLSLEEGTEISGLRTADVTLMDVHDDVVVGLVRMKPLKIRSVLEVGDDRYLIRGFLVDLSLRITSNITSGSTTYALQKAGHVTHVQVANGDRTETAFGQDLEALLAGAGVTSIFAEVHRAAGVHMGWQREAPQPLHWKEYLVPDSWDAPHAPLLH